MSNRKVPLNKGKQVLDWFEYNCYKCVKFNLDRAMCDIDRELTFALVRDGTVSLDVYQRMEVDKHQSQYTWKCPEIQFTQEWLKKENSHKKSLFTCPFCNQKCSSNSLCEHFIHIDQNGDYVFMDQDNKITIKL